MINAKILVPYAKARGGELIFVGNHIIEQFPLHIKNGDNYKPIFMVFISLFLHFKKQIIIFANLQWVCKHK